MAANPEDFDELRRKLERAHKMSIVSPESPEDSTLYGASARAIRELSEALREARGN